VNFGFSEACADETTETICSISCFCSGTWSSSGADEPKAAKMFDTCVPITAAPLAGASRDDADELDAELAETEEEENA
jgi:hypothetical protein